MKKKAEKSIPAPTGKAAGMEADITRAWWGYQPKEPREVKNLRKQMCMMMGLICCICLLSGCGGKELDQEENFAVVDTMRTQVKNEGIFYIDGYTEMMKFYDFNLAQSIPICDRPNCEHNAAGCNAYFAQGFMSGMGCYRDKLYYYDNMSQGLPFYQCDKNGSNRKLLTKLNEEGDYESLWVELPMFFVENEAIFGMTYSRFLAEPITKEDGSIIEREIFWMLGKLHLESGAFEIVKEPEKVDDSGWINTHGYMDGTVFYAKASAGYTEQHRYDLKNNEDILLTAPDGGQIGFLGMVDEEQKVIYKEQKGNLYNVYALDMQTGKIEVVFQKKAKAGKALYLEMAGEQLCYCVYEEGKGTVAGEEFGVYDFVTGEEKQITQDEYWYSPVVAKTDDWYVGITEEGTVCIPKDAYKKKDWSKVQVIGSF